MRPQLAMLVIRHHLRFVQGMVAFLYPCVFCSTTISASASCSNCESTTSSYLGNRSTAVHARDGFLLRIHLSPRRQGGSNSPCVGARACSARMFSLILARFRLSLLLFSLSLPLPSLCPITIGEVDPWSALVTGCTSYIRARRKYKLCLCGPTHKYN